MHTMANMAAAEHVYERILQRVDHAELSAQCRDVAQKEAKLIQRRIRGARRVLQLAYDVDAARRRLSGAPEPSIATATVTPATAQLVDEIEKLQRKIARNLRKLMNHVADEPVHPVVPTVEKGAQGKQYDSPTKNEPVIKPENANKPVVEELQPVREAVAVVSPVRRKGKKRRLSRESLESPRKPPRPGRLLVAVEGEEGEEEEEEEEWEESAGPHVMTSDVEDDDDETEEEDEEVEEEGEVPVELELLDSDSDSEFHVATSLEKARRLRKISSERRMSELPGLIRAVLTEIKRLQWEKLPRDLLGTLSATMGAATTLKPGQRQQIHDELNKLRAVAMKIDDATARKYPTLNGSKARFLSSIDDLPDDDQDMATSLAEAAAVEVVEEPVYCENIEALCTATAELASHADDNDESHSMEDIEELLTVVEHVFDNPTAARSAKYRVMVTTALEMLIAYVQAIPRNTRRRQQCEQTLVEYHLQLTKGLARATQRVGV